MAKRIEFKPGATVRVISPTLLWIFQSLRKVLDAAEPEVLTVTSVNDGRHMEGSRHYTDEAIDLRSKSFVSGDAKRAFAAALTLQLNSNRSGTPFVVILESEGLLNEHFHIQPRRGYTYKD
jgi:hypothetical protein